MRRSGRDNPYGDRDNSGEDASAEPSSEDLPSDPTESGDEPELADGEASDEASDEEELSGRGPVPPDPRQLAQQAAGSAGLVVRQATRSVVKNRAPKAIRAINWARLNIKGRQRTAMVKALDEVTRRHHVLFVQELGIFAATGTNITRARATRFTPKSNVIVMQNASSYREIPDSTDDLDTFGRTYALIGFADDITTFLQSQGGTRLFVAGQIHVRIEEMTTGGQSDQYEILDASMAVAAAKVLAEGAAALGGASAPSPSDIGAAAGDIVGTGIKGALEDSNRLPGKAFRKLENASQKLRGMPGRRKGPCFLVRIASYALPADGPGEFSTFEKEYEDNDVKIKRLDGQTIVGRRITFSAISDQIIGMMADLTERLGYSPLAEGLPEPQKDTTDDEEEEDDGEPSFGEGGRISLRTGTDPTLTRSPGWTDFLNLLNEKISLNAKAVAFYDGSTWRATVVKQGRVANVYGAGTGGKAQLLQEGEDSLSSMPLPYEDRDRRYEK